MSQTQESRTKNIKLSSGLEILADIVSYNDGMLMVHKPVQVNYRYFQNTSIPMISFTKYMFMSAENDFVFNVKDIQNVAEPLDIVVDYYKSTVDNIYDSCDAMLREELSKILFSMSDEDDKTKLYESVLQNFESDIKN